MKWGLKYIFLLVAMVLLAPSCSHFEDEPSFEETLYPSVDDTTLDKGVENFSVEIPILDRFRDFVEANGGQDVEVELYLRGRENRGSYTINATLDVVNDDKIRFTSTDEGSLAALHHQEYFLNYLTVRGATRSSEESYPEGAVVIGAILSVVDSADIYFVTSFSANSSVNGSGGRFDPYIITKVEDFTSLLATRLSGGDDMSGVYLLQSDDLDFAGVDMSCMGGDSSTLFRGHYDGGMMKIENLVVDTEGQGDCCAIFYGIGEGGVFCNSIMRSVDVRGDNYVGIVAAKLSGGVITNIFVEDGCRVSGDLYCGGLVGAGRGAILNSVFRGAVSGVGYCGGFVGSVVDPTEDDILYNNIFSGSVSATNPDMTILDGFVGGLVGYVEFAAQLMSEASGSFIVDKALISGSISSVNNNVGGLVGSLDGICKKMSVRSVEIGMTASTSDYMSYGDHYEAKVTIEGGHMVGGLFGSVRNTLRFGTEDYDTMPQLSGGDNYFSENSGTSITGGEFVGGAIGLIFNVDLNGFSFTNSVNVDATANSIGGVIGYGDNILLSDALLTNHGAVAGVEEVGGLFGYMSLDGSLYSDQTAGLINYGNIVGGYGYNTGGCVGRLELGNNQNKELDNIEITYKNYGQVSGYHNVGGFAGHVGDYTYCSAESDNNGSGAYNVIVSGHTCVGGLYGEYYTTDDDVRINITAPSDVQVTTTSSFSAGGVIGEICSNSINYDSNVRLTVKADQHVMVYGNGSGCYGGVVGKVSDLVSVTFTTGSYVTGDIVSSTTGSTDYYDLATGGVVGGIVSASMDTVDFISCYNRVNVTNNEMSSGGIVGYLWVNCAESSKVSFIDCCNWGDVNSTASDSRAGGIVGFSDNDGTTSFNSCYNAGAIIGTDSRGGIVGRLENYCKMENCFNMGSVPMGGHYVAGLIGSVDDDDNDAKLYMRYCYNIGSSGYGTIGGEENLKKGEIDIAHVYYYDVATEGREIDLPSDDKTTKCNRDAMLGLGRDELNSSYWTFPSGANELPYLNGVNYYEYKPAI